MRAGSVGVIVHSIEQLAVGDPGGRKEHVVGIDQVFGGEDLLEIEIVLQRVLLFALIARPELALDFSTHADQSRCGDHRLG